ncbi:hypothetical protein T05_10253 [Trichinella murrelli]|uniref:Uncharacterized protein n=1 Tax=Trichinella murrelli TaxID=144512 RepID=A0A0V0UDJ9_9BILA|nr:hypothetical protein T05_10253 [Trichinella murrelli]
MIGITSLFCNLGRLPEPDTGTATSVSTVLCFFDNVEFHEEPRLLLDDNGVVSSLRQHWGQTFMLL